MIALDVSSGNEGTDPMPPIYDPLIYEINNRLSDGHPAHAIMTGQFVLRRKFLSWLERALSDFCTQFFPDLNVTG